jgi:ABC-2 type transport system ATP-binding protein
MLEINNLTKQFGTFTAVDNLSLNVKAGELFGFLGPNGAGKTTTIKMIVGLYTPTSGKIFVNRLNAVTHRLEINQVTSYIPDQPFVYDKLTGKEFLYFCGGLYNLDKKAIKNKIEELVDILKIEDWLNKRTEFYSQGMRQRIVIASAFLNDPEFLVIDEPMVGLDPQSAFIVKQVLIQKAREGKTIFMSTHSLHIVEEICSRVGIIRKGVLIYDSSIENLKSLKTEKNNNFEELFIELTSDETDITYNKI